MPTSSRKTGRAARAAAEAAYANLLKENTTLVGNVGETWDTYAAKLNDAAAAQERYEEARAAAVKSGAVTNDQLEQMGYKRTPKLSVLPRVGTPTAPKTDSAAEPGPSSDPQTNGAAAEPILASLGAGNHGEHS
jgi:hypothetical protein